jgi:hypothetical protein
MTGWFMSFPGSVPASGCALANKLILNNRINGNFIVAAIRDRLAAFVKIIRK